MSSPAVTATPNRRHTDTYIPAQWPIVLEDAQSKGVFAATGAASVDKRRALVVSAATDIS